MNDPTAFDFREYAGTVHFMKQLQREYNFPVHTWREDENGNRVLLRSEIQ